MFLPQVESQEDEERDFPDTRYEPAKVLTDEETAKMLAHYIDRLPERQRLCFILKHQNGLGAGEIARVLGCSIPTVKVHLFRAVKALQSKVARYL